MEQKNSEATRTNYESNQRKEFISRGLSQKNSDSTNDITEGATTKAIEQQTAKIPSGVYLALALGSIAISAYLAATSKEKGTANFVGQWAPTFLMLGIYNKIVKTQGSDSETPA